MRFSLLASLAIISTAYANETTKIPLNALNITERFSYEQYSLPNNQPALGVLGAHTLFNLTPNWYAGASLYGGVNGALGGYFALSLDGGYQHSIYKKLWLDIGSSIGAGGGRSAPVGGGFYLEPYAGLSYHWKHVQLGANYSYITFTNGNIHSHQWGVSLGLPTSINYHQADYSDNTIGRAYGLALSENYIALLASSYFPNKGTRTTSGNRNDNAIQMLGVEAGHYFTANWFAYGQAKGAYHGRSNGYADALLGAGYRLPLLRSGQLNALAKFGLGSGGGGAVNTAGGFVIQPQLGLEYRINKSFAIEADGGYLAAPSGNFNNLTASLLLKYYFDQAHTDEDSNTDVGALSYQNWRVRLLNQTYFSPRAASGQTNPTMQLINLDFDHTFNPYVYVTGQTAFAYQGQHTGGYFSGMLGVGGQYPGMQKRWSVFAEALVGTAGGAGLDIGGGALYEPVIGLNYQLTHYWGLQTSVGRLMAFSGGFHSTVLNVGLSLQFATLNGNSR